MLRRSLLVALTFLAIPALAQMPASPAPGTPAPPAVPNVFVRLTTDSGAIVIELERAKAPITVTNFLRYVDQKRFDNATFYRATKVGTGYGLIQGGVRNDPKKVLPAIKMEPTTVTGLTHADGTLSMARGAAPNTATGDFFITIGNLPSMDADPTKTGNDALGYAAFGRVASGMEVVRKILEAPTSPTEGEGVMKGQMLAPKIKILSARRVPAPPPAPAPVAAQPPVPAPTPATPPQG